LHERGHLGPPLKLLHERGHLGPPLRDINPVNCISLEVWNV
jgi:hypothetical protein